MASSQLTVFVSSKIEELGPERSAVKAALEELQIDGWVFELDAGARPQSMQQTFLDEVERSDLYIGLFWRGYGDYTIEEFKHARQLKKPCFLYEKRIDIDGQRDGRLEKWLAELSHLETGLTRKWFNTPDELKEFVKRDVARWQAEIIRRYLVSGAPQVYQPPAPVEDRTHRELVFLLNKVEQFWIKGVLDHSVHHQFEIELGKEKMGKAIAPPWDAVVEVPNKAENLPLTRGDVSDWFTDLDRYLLILGEPGSGKTTTLLQLARHLVAKARKDTSQPVPTIFSLSSWGNKEESIVEWMVRELSEKYQVPKKIGREWLAQQRLLPLLDGLDEVRPDLQDDCVRAINAFVQEYRSGLVVCSRLQEYMSLPVRLKLNGAICLQPLSLQQVGGYLEKAGLSLAALKHALPGDSSLQELIKTPLMLSIVSLGYEHAPLRSLEREGTESVNSLRAEVFDTYIDRMVQRKGKAGQVYSKEKLNEWLGWLAGQMKAHSQSIFLIEQLQADWLGTHRQRLFYVLASRVLGGLFLGLVWGLPAALTTYIEERSVKNTGVVWLFVISTGLVFGFVSMLITCVKQVLNEKVEFVCRLVGWRRTLTDIGIYASMWLPTTVIAIVALLEDESLMTAGDLIPVVIMLAPIIGLTQWFLFEARSDQHRISADITTVETLKWSWKAGLKSGLKGFVVVGILLLPVAVFFGYSNFGPYESALSIVFVVTLFAIFISFYAFWGGVIGFLFGGFNEGIVEKKTKPNQGIRLTIRNAVVWSATIGLLLGAIVTIMYMSAEYMAGRKPSLMASALLFSQASLIIGVPVAFRNGVYDAIKHYTLRAMLVSCKYIPRNYVKFLNHAVALTLLQRVGGGYIFIHRTFLEHYAATYESRHQRDRA